MAKPTYRKRAKAKIRNSNALKRKRIVDLILQAAIEGDDEFLSATLFTELMLFSKGETPNLCGLPPELKLGLLNLIFDPCFEMDILFDGRPIMLNTQRTASSVDDPDDNRCHITYRDDQPRVALCFGHIMSDQILIDFPHVSFPAVSKGDTIYFEFGTELSFRRLYDDNQIESKALVGQLWSETLYLRVEDIIHTLSPEVVPASTTLLLVPTKENTIIDIFTDGSLVKLELAAIISDDIDPLHIRNRMN